MEHLGDITKINGAEIPVVDVITGGSPCQDLSVAGKRAGLAGERSGLFMEQIRIVKEMREQDVRSGRNPAHARPRYMVWENVPGAFSSGNQKGADFAAVLEEIIKAADPGADVCVCVPDGGWTKSGCYYAEDGTWSVAWRVHDAQFWGVPQRRKRIALVADFGGLSAPEVLFERKSLSRNPEPCGAAGEGTAESPAGCADGSSQPEHRHDRYFGNGGDHDGRCGTSTSRALSFQERAGCDGGARESFCKMSESEPCQPSTTNPSSSDYPQAFGICSFDCNAMKSSNPHSGFYEADTSRTLDLNGGNPACNQGGIGQLNQISMAEQTNTLDTMHDQQAVLCFQNTGQGWWNESDVGATIRTPCGGDAVKANLVAAVDCRNGVENGEIHSQDSRYKALGEISETVSAKYGTGGNNQPLVVNSAVCVGNAVVQPVLCLNDQGGSAMGVSHDVAGALRAEEHGHQPLVYENNGTLQAKSSGGTSLNLQNVCRQYNIVRRLTPLECERLQGYPDGWTDIGDWVDSKGKKHKAADSPRYKALGNSIALPFWFWLLRRISAQYEHPATLGSLFDGIGGFPLCWERCNGHGTALWASEIEEFPIAVTKIRFPETKGETT